MRITWGGLGCLSGNGLASEGCCAWLTALPAVRMRARAATDQSWVMMSLPEAWMVERLARITTVIESAIALL
jgi:hypothetical protein